MEITTGCDKAQVLESVCLICGTETIKSNERVVVVVVKEEVNWSTDEEEDDDKQLSEGTGQSGLSVGGAAVWTEEENEIYNWFVKWFRLQLSGKGKGSKKCNLGWDGDSGNDHFPFCDKCKGHLGHLVELQKKVEELQRSIQEGLEEVKGTANQREELFRKNGIYDKDQRHYRARRQFVTDFKAMNPEQKGSHTSKQLRRSSRRVAANDPESLDKLPAVLLSTEDKVNADQHRLLNAPQVSLDDDQAPVDATSTGLSPPGVIEEDQHVEGPPPNSEFQLLVDAYNELDNATEDVEEAFSPLPSPEPPQSPPSSAGRPTRKRNVKTNKPQDYSALFDNDDDDTGEEESEEEDSPPKKVTRRSTRTRASTAASEKCSKKKKMIQDEDGDWAEDKAASDLSSSDEDPDDLSPRRRHGNPKPVNCPICERPTTGSHLKGHLWSHKSPDEKRQALESGSKDVPTKELRLYQCDQCGFSVGTPHLLNQHKNRVHVTAEEKRSKMELCPECGGTYLKLKEHRSLVHGVGADRKIFRCLEPECGAEFKTQKRLTSHRNSVHLKLRPFKCTQCPRTFSGRRYLDNHMNLHNGVRPWKCDHCPSAFGSKSNLQKHMGHYHTPGKPAPKRKPFVRGPTMLGSDTRKNDLISEGKYLPPSALATWAAGREPTSHFPVGSK